MSSPILYAPRGLRGACWQDPSVITAYALIPSSFKATQSVGHQTLTFIIEAIDAVDAGAFMVATQQEEVLRVLNLVGQQEADRLQRLLPPVYIVTQEEVVALWGEAPIFKESEQIIVLPVDVTCRAGAQKKKEEEGRSIHYNKFLFPFHMEK